MLFEFRLLSPGGISTPRVGWPNADLLLFTSFSSSHSQLLPSQVDRSIDDLWIADRMM